MLTSKLDGLKTLEDFYESIVFQQTENNPGYCDQHNGIRKCIKNSLSYKELGTHQGATAAAALLANPTPKEIHLVDHNLEKFNPNKHLFEDWCKNNNVKLKLYECDSRDIKCTGIVDTLLIDSRHVRSHMEQELYVHAKDVKKYIIFHDTTAKPELWAGVNNFCNEINPWVIHERNQVNVGYTIIKNTSS